MGCSASMCAWLVGHDCSTGGGGLARGAMDGVAEGEVRAAELSLIFWLGAARASFYMSEESRGRSGDSVKRNEGSGCLL